MNFTNNQILNKFSIEKLNSSRLVIKAILERLGYSRVIINKQGPLVNPLGDDTLKREMEMFKLLKGAFSETLKGNRVGNAINRFVEKGVITKEGKLIYNQNELDRLNEKLSKYLGNDIASQTSKDTLKMIEDQYQVTKDLVSKAADKVGRNINTNFSKVDHKTIDVIHNNNNFFISGTYDKVLIGRVNEAVATHVESGMPKEKLAESIKETMEEELPPRSDTYYQILANDTLGRARVFGQVNSYREARIRKYEIIAVMDERTSEICEYMDGKIFEVEIASGIVKDIQNFGIPENENQINEMKALRPWVFFDSQAAQAGKNSLYYNDDKGNPLYLPNSGYNETPEGFSLADKMGISGEEIQGLSTENVNAPCLPPFHAHCRSTTAISEEDVKTLDWVEDIDINDLGFGSELTNIMNGESGKITNIIPGDNPIITVEGPTITTKAPIGGIVTQFTPTVITKPKEGKTIKDFIPKKQYKESEVPNKDRLKKEHFFTGPKKLQKQYFDLINESIDKMPDGLFSPINRFVAFNKSKKTEGGYIVGQHVLNRLTKKSFINIYTKIPPIYRTIETGEYISLGRLKLTVHHEVGHAFWDNITDIKIPEAVKVNWLNYHLDLMKTIEKDPNGVIVSHYARTNAVEHFCESIAHWFSNKELFKEEEPNAFQFINRYIIPLFEGKK
jgi:SPP1 gp7 family putative phage head morphogenesis protein